MSAKTFVLETMKNQGRASALALQEQAGSMTGTQLNRRRDYIPDFQAAQINANMLTRKPGFVCKSTAGRVVKLLQSYDSDIYHQEPEALSAQWGFVWSQDPAQALPFIALSTSPYNTGDCCTENGSTWRSVIDNNVWAPSAYPAGWEEAR